MRLLSTILYLYKGQKIMKKMFLIFSHKLTPAQIEDAKKSLGIDEFVELPEEGTTFDAGDPCAVVESVKAASDIYCPIAGEIVEGNAALEADPALANTDPYGEGWIFKIRVNDPTSVESLMSPDEYKALIG